MPSIQCWFNTLRPKQNYHRFVNDVFKWIFLNGNALILLTISLKFVPKVGIDNIQKMAWRLSDYKPLSEPKASLLTYIWVNDLSKLSPILKSFVGYISLSFDIHHTHSMDNANSEILFCEFAFSMFASSCWATNNIDMVIRHKQVDYDWKAHCLVIQISSPFSSPFQRQ